MTLYEICKACKIYRERSALACARATVDECAQMQPAVLPGEGVARVLHGRQDYRRRGLHGLPVENLTDAGRRGKRDISAPRVRRRFLVAG